VTGHPNIALVQTVGAIAGLWAASDIGYYYLLPALGQRARYSDGPVAAALYYTFWVGIAVIAFWPVYASWPRYAKWATFESRLTSIVVWTIAFAASVLFAAYVLPQLPQFIAKKDVGVPELPLATPWYFLPKSVEILYQQLLVVALVLTLAAEKYSLKRISLWCAGLFAVTHLLLVFDDVPWGYVARFTVLASLFGLAFPYLILRVPNGFAYSYVVHWAYYATTVVMARASLGSTLFKFLKGLIGVA
jgi:hypothetical protein